MLLTTSSSVNFLPSNPLNFRWHLSHLILLDIDAFLYFLISSIFYLFIYFLIYFMGSNNLQVKQCNAAADLRDSSYLEFADLTFALRHDPVRLARLTQFVLLRNMSSREAKASGTAVPRAHQPGSWDLLNNLNDLTNDKPLLYAKVSVII